jgi:DNA-binding IclR family transcriptional regulator
MKPTQLATVLGVNVSTMKVHLMRLVDRGLVWKDGQGQYMHIGSRHPRAQRVKPL